MRKMYDFILPRGARQFLIGHPEAVRLLLYLLEQEGSFTAPEIRDGLGYDSSYNINKDLQQLKWHSIIEKDSEKTDDDVVRWKVVFLYREGLKQFLEDIDDEAEV